MAVDDSGDRQRDRHRGERQARAARHCETERRRACGQRGHGDAADDDGREGGDAQQHERARRHHQPRYHRGEQREGPDAARLLEQLPEADGPPVPALVGNESRCDKQHPRGARMRAEPIRGR